MNTPTTVENMTLIASFNNIGRYSEESAHWFDNGAVITQSGEGGDDDAFVNVPRDTWIVSIDHFDRCKPLLKAKLEGLRVNQPPVPFARMNPLQQDFARKCFAWSVVA